MLAFAENSIAQETVKMENPPETRQRRWLTFQGGRQGRDIKMNPAWVRPRLARVHPLAEVADAGSLGGRNPARGPGWCVWPGGSEGRRGGQRAWARFLPRAPGVT